MSGRWAGPVAAIPIGPRTRLHKTLLQRAPLSRALLFGLLLFGAGTATAAEPSEPPLYRRVFFPAADAAQLVPPDFRPISSDELEARIDASGAVQSQPEGHLVRSRYLVRADVEGRLLDCRRSEWEVRYGDDAPGRIVLGRTNVALEPPEVDADGFGGPRLATSSEGQLLALVNRDATLSAAWTLAGQPDRLGGVRFRVLLPPAIDATMELALPAGWLVETDRGVARRSQAAPEGAGDSAPEASSDDPSAGSVQWWHLEFGGVEQIELRLRREPHRERARNIVVRRTLMDYRVGPDGLSWTARYLFDMPIDGILPPLGMQGEGRVSGIVVEGRPAAWSEFKSQGTTFIRVETPPEGIASSSGAGTVSMVISGVAPRPRAVVMDLPWIHPIEHRVLTADPTAVLQLRIAPTLRLEQIELGDEWRLVEQSALDDGAWRMRITGPAETPPPAVLLADVEAPAEGVAVTRFSVEQERLFARWTCRLRPPRGLPQVLHLTVGERWQVDAISLPASGRSQPIARANQGGAIPVWIEPDDVIDGEIHLELVGSDRLPSPVGGEVRLPAVEFVRLQDAWPVEAVVFQVPQNHVVQLGTEATRRRVMLDRFPDPLQQLIKPLPSNSLVLQGSGGLPAISLRPRDAKFDAQVRVTAEPSGESVEQQIHIRCTPRSGLLNDIRVHVQPDAGEMIRWSAVLAEGQRRIAVTSVREGGLDAAVWRLQFAQPVGEAIDLTGRMQVTSQGTVGLPLVSVPAAADQRAEVWLDSQILVGDPPAGLERLPNAAEGEALPIRYRYAPGTSEAVRIRLAEKLAAPPVVWDRRLDGRVDASGHVEIDASVWASGQEALRFEYPESLEVREITRGGNAIPVAGLVRGRGYLEIPGPWGTAPAVIRLAGRAHRLGPLGWWWKPPDLRSSGPSVEGRWLMSIDEGLWPLRMASTTLRLSEATRYVVGIDQHVILLRADLCMAVAIALAVAALGLGWWLGRFCSWLPSVLALAALAFAAALSGPLGAAIAIVGLALIAGGITAILEARWGGGADAKERRGSSWGGLTLSLLVVGITTAGWLAPRGWSQGIFSGADAAAVLIPVDQEGNQFGENVYIPETLYRQLFVDQSAVEATEPATFRQAQYELEIGRAAESTAGAAVRLNATWIVEVEAADRDILLPIAPELVRQITLDEGPSSRTLRWQPEGAGVRLQPPRTGAVPLHLELATPARSGDGRGGESMRFAIPAIHRSQLSVEHEAGIEGIEVVAANGVSQSAAGRRLETMLGPVEEISVRWRDATPRSATRDAEALQASDGRPRLWVRIGATSLVQEWELQPRVNRVGQETQIEIAARDLPVITSHSWRLVDSQLTDSGRAHLTLVATGPEPGPVRLLWERSLTPGEQIDSVRIPSVRIDGSRSAGILVGFDLPSGWEVPRGAGEIYRDLEAAEFLSHWEGYRGNVTSAVEMTSAASPVVPLLPPGDWVTQVSEVHRLNVGASQLKLDYRLVAETSGPAIRPLRVQLPDAFQLDSAVVNGVALGSVPKEDESGRRWISIVPPEIGTSIELAIAGRLEYDAGRRFRPPRLVLVGLEPQTSRYEMTRDAEILATELQPSPLAQMPLRTSTVEQLSRLEMPMWQWVVPVGKPVGEDPQFLPGRYRVSERNANFDATIVTTMRWNEGAWMAESDLRIRPKTANPDFLTVEVPAAWSDGLQVEPTSDWLAGPAGEDATRIIQIIPPQAEPGTPYALRLSGRVTAGPSGRVAVPTIRLPRGRSRGQFFILPQRLTTQSIEWSTQGISEVVEPEAVGIPPESVPPEHVVYRAVLEEVPAAPVLTTLATSAGPAAVAPLRDARLFLADEGRSHLAVTWDLVPAGRSQVEVRLPQGATVLGVWSAGSIAKWQQHGSRVEIDLNLSGLASRLELLLRLPPEGTDASELLPKLLAIPVERSWLTVLRPPGTARAGIHPSGDLWQQASEADLHLGRAAGIWQSLSLSVDALAERPPNEINAWIGPWLARFEQIRAASTGRPNGERLEELHQQIEQYVERIGGVEGEVVATESRWNNDRWRVTATATAAGQPAAPQVRLEITPEHASGRLAVIALMACAGMLAFAARRDLTRPLRALVAAAIFATTAGVGLAVAGIPAGIVGMAVSVILIEAVLATDNRRSEDGKPSAAPADEAAGSRSRIAPEG